MSKPLVSVIVTTYNQAEYLQEALDSIRNQTLANDHYETIVINDGSTDETSAILERNADWIRYIDRDENRGVVYSCREAFDRLDGRYLTRVDSDDWVHADWLETVLECMEDNPDAVLVTPDHYRVRDDDKEYVHVDSDDLFSLVAAGILYRTAAVEQSGGFREFFWEEHDLHLRLQGKGAFIHVPEPLYTYRRHGESRTHDSQKVRDGWLALVEEWGVDRLQAAGSDPGLDEALKYVDGESDR